MSKLALFQAAKAADQAWMSEIVRLFGDRDAGSVRFHGKGAGEPGSRLREFYDRYVKTRDAYALRR
ncbi:MAG: hypothetical protein ABUL73_01570 [Alphaproteobacteria bacterium]